MGKLAQLGLDIVKLWSKYSGSYLSGMKNTLIDRLYLRRAEHHPLQPERPSGQAFCPEADPGDYPHLCRSLPRDADGAAGRVPVLRPAVLQRQRPALQLGLGGGHRGRLHQHRRLHGGIRPRRHHLASTPAPTWRNPSAAASSRSTRGRRRAPWPSA